MARRFARKGQGIYQNMKTSEESWEGASAALNNLKDHIEDRALPLVKYANSLLHEVDWGEDSFTHKHVDVSAVEALLVHLRLMVAEQTECLEAIEKDIATNKAAAAMKFCT